jgi:hypothetical protein
MMLQLHEKTQLEGVKKERERERPASVRMGHHAGEQTDIF